MFNRMRFPAILLVVTVVICSQTASAQSKSEIAEWINTKGKEIFRDITGNQSIQWQMDAYGNLKITDYRFRREGEGKGEREGKSNIVKRYSYMNLYEMDSKGSFIGKSPENKNTQRLVLQCKSEKKACIKSRHYISNTNFKTMATPALSFPLNKEFDNDKVELLERKLRQAVEIFQ